jgi:hypothetical protein
LVLVFLGTAGLDRRSQNQVGNELRPNLNGPSIAIRWGVRFTNTRRTQRAESYFFRGFGLLQILTAATV